MGEEGKTSLYVGDLEPSVTDSELFDAFSHASHLSSVRVCRDLTTGRSLGYGYVTFDYPREAKIAMEMLNFTALKGRSIRVMYYVHNPSLLKRGVGNIFIKNLDKSSDQEGLYDTFSCFGSILRFKLATDASGESRGFGFVQYNTEVSAHKAIEHMNGMLLNDTEVYVGPFLQRDSPTKKEMFTDIYVKNLSKSLTDKELNTIFQEFGPTTSCVIIRDGEVPQGKSKGFGFVNFKNPEDAEKAVEALNGKKFDDKEWFVTKSKKKYQRESEVKGGLKHAVNKSQGSSNLCVTKLDKRVTDEILKDFFSSYGTITSCKVVRDSRGVSKGSGIVSFLKSAEALRAVRI
ncbi:PREDICTED: polyadenylate-binding protein 8-like [Camelina sativa]|uniref:Polyadenylate-binding protein 8-like n=1 Tax=Camelina sativa TaxID=90675 RepID=A0ABM1RDE1_CAMSA|nr:PREDICTED: polyadenylate-binding protein 8-like [Camelina sativa]